MGELKRKQEQREQQAQQRASQGAQDDYRDRQHPGGRGGAGEAPYSKDGAHFTASGARIPPGYRPEVGADGKTYYVSPDGRRFEVQGEFERTVVTGTRLSGPGGMGGRYPGGPASNERAETIVTGASPARVRSDGASIGAGDYDDYPMGNNNTQTVETTTYTTEKDGRIETTTTRKVLIQGDADEDVDHDALLMEAIKHVTDMNPDLSVERIEIKTQSEEVTDV